MPGSIHVIGGGAAQGLVKQLQNRFAAERGFAIRGHFGAVGAMRDKFLAGEACDVVILTRALVDSLVTDGHLVAGSKVALGVVKTGVAVKSGEALPDIATAAALKAALLAARGICFPDPERATAGIHFMKVLNALGVADRLAAKLRPYPNGATALREMAASDEQGLVGCTQVTEILYTAGVVLAGLLPQEFELATVYTAAVCTRAREPEAAARFIAMLAGTDAAAIRATGGFEPV